MHAQGFHAPFGLYIHIPFCHHKCPYCDFNTYAMPGFPEKDYTQALCDELALRCEDERWAAHPLRSIFFGGGTPSIFESASIKKILDCVREKLSCTQKLEITLEANPVGLDEGYFQEIQEAGVNRISFGAQSFQEKSLKILGRNHVLEDFMKAWESARRAGMQNLSLDLLYASPGQSPKDFEKDLEYAVHLAPEHISSYCLSLEPGTPYYQAHEKGSISVPLEEDVLLMMDMLEDKLTLAGIEHYELSNFAKPGFRSSHNWGYWEGEDYLGLGAGAHSYRSDDLSRFHSGRRWSNIALPRDYMRQVSSGKLAEAWSEELDAQARQYEFFFLGLRKIEGVKRSEFLRRFDVEMEAVYGAILRKLENAELLVDDEEKVFLTRKGRRISDSVFGEFAG
jgi:oxygen-independent coproporphyrinogen-3 oxidase